MREKESFVNMILKPATVAVLTTVCPLAGGVYQFMSAIETENLSKLVNDLNDRVTKLEENDRETFIRHGSAEDGESLLKYSFIKAARCHRKEQIDKFVDIIMAALDKEVIDNKEAEVLIDIVSDLNIEEALFFYRIYTEIDSKNKIVEEYSNGKGCKYKKGFGVPVMEDFAKNDDLFKDRSAALFNRLVGKGLLEQVSASEGGANLSGALDTEPGYKGSCYYLTHYGKLFVMIVYECEY